MNRAIILLSKFSLNRAIFFCFIFFSAWNWSQAGFIVSKAYLAEILIAHAWKKTLRHGEHYKPWPWADTWPVAQLQFQDDDNLYVLAGAKGNSLAFGPGHSSDTALPGTNGTSVVGGHRDTHFSILKDAKINNKIIVVNKFGQKSSYTIQKHWIANNKTDELIIDKTENSLYLITCYPFDTIMPRGDQRFIVKARKQTDAFVAL